MIIIFHVYFIHQVTYNSDYNIHTDYMIIKFIKLIISRKEALI